MCSGLFLSEQQVAYREGRECEISVEHAANKLPPLPHEAQWLHRESCACAQLPLLPSRRPRIRSELEREA